MTATTTNAPRHLTVYYDGGCALCTREMGVLMRANRAGLLSFVNIDTPGFDTAPLGVSREALMTLLHVRDATGAWLIGVPAIQAIYAATGHTRIAAALAHPTIARMASPAYAWLARHRYSLPRWLLSALHMRAEHCTPDGECRLH